MLPNIFWYNHEPKITSKIAGVTQRITNPSPGGSAIRAPRRNSRKPFLTPHTPLNNTRYSVEIKYRHIVPTQKSSVLSASISFPVNHDTANAPKIINDPMIATLCERDNPQNSSKNAVDGWRIEIELATAAQNNNPKHPPPTARNTPDSAPNSRPK